MTDEPNWKKAHNIRLPNFSQAAMRRYHAMMTEVAEQMVLKWERLNPGEEIDVGDDMTRLTLDTIGICGFGFRFNSFYRDHLHPFVEAMVVGLETTAQIRGFPKEHLMFWRRERRLEANIRFMNATVDRIIQERKQSGHDVADLLGFMLSGVDKDTGERLDDLNIRCQIITFLIAGHETTSGLLSFAIYYLTRNPDVLAKCY